MSTTESILARQLSDAQFLELLAGINAAGRSHGRACALAVVVDSFMSDLEGMQGLLAVEDAAARLTYALQNCYAKPEQLAVYGRAACNPEKQEAE